MAENGQGRVPLTGKAVYDEELYGDGSTQYDKYAAEDGQDERERAVARCASLHVVFPHAAVPLTMTQHRTHIHSKLQSYTAPKNLTIPDDDAGNEEVCLLCTTHTAPHATYTAC